MLEDHPVVGFVPSTDLNRSRQFYGDVLGLPIVSQDTFAMVIRTPSATVRVTNAGPGLRVQPFTVLGWEVDDIRAVARELAARGVQFLRPAGLEQDEDAVWTAPDGTEVAWFKDPDGNTLSLDHHPVPGRDPEE